MKPNTRWKSAHKPTGRRANWNANDVGKQISKATK